MSLLDSLRGNLRFDGWSNMLTALGNQFRDKRVANVAFERPVDWGEIRASYRSGALAQRIVRRPAADATREGVEVSVEEDVDLGRQVQDVLIRHKALVKFRRAIEHARAWGGGYVLLGVNEGRGLGSLEEPLDLRRVKSLDQLAVFDRFEVTALEWCGNPLAPGEEYGEPITYQVSPRYPDRTGVLVGSFKVHASRILPFRGHIISPDVHQAQQGAGDSVLYLCHEELRSFGVSWAAIEALIQDFSQAVIKMRGLTEAVAQDKESLIQKRVQILDTSRSFLRALLLDADLEDFERKATPMTGLPEAFDRLMLVLSAAAEIPVTLLMGQAPAGLSATGDADIRLYYDHVRDFQATHLAPALERLIEVIFASKDGPTRGVEPDAWSVSFRPLWQLTEGEQAQRNLAQAQADTAYYQMGAVSAEEVAASRFGGGAYSLATRLDREAREASLSLPESEMQQPAGGVPVQPQGAPALAPDGSSLQDTALNGAQLESALGIVRSVVAGEIPRESGVTLLQVGLNRPLADAERIMGSAGRGFEPASQAAPPAAPPTPPTPRQDAAGLEEGLKVSFCSGEVSRGKATIALELLLGYSAADAEARVLEWEVLCRLREAPDSPGDAGNTGPGPGGPGGGPPIRPPGQGGENPGTGGENPGLGGPGQGGGPPSSPPGQGGGAPGRGGNPLLAAPGADGSEDDGPAET